jgi:4-hydroxy-2-oxovalerate aldolase
MFCIPGIATLEDVELAAEHGADFLRIGTNITEVEESEEFVRLAADKDMFVTANYMKSYARSPDIFTEKVKMSEEYGVDMVYIVDSAGGMLPETLIEYFRAVREVSDVPVGFHGHDNLGLAVANSRAMAEEGALVIDTSLQGLGRSAGNAGTEKTVAALEKSGYETGTDLLRLLRTGQKYVSPIRSNPAHIPLDVVGGQVEFHSSHMTKILDMAYKYDADPARLIQEVCEHDKIYAPKSLVQRLAQQIEGDGKGQVTDYGISRYPGDEESV